MNFIYYFMKLLFWLYECESLVYWTIKSVSYWNQSQKNVKTMDSTSLFPKLSSLDHLHQNYLREGLLKMQIPAFSAWWACEDLRCQGSLGTGSQSRFRESTKVALETPHCWSKDHGPWPPSFSSANWPQPLPGPSCVVHWPTLRCAA